MNIDELVSELDNMYMRASQGESVLMVNIFGIKYCEFIGRGKVATPVQIAERSTVPDSYATEIQKGIKLAKHVALK